MFSKMFYNNQKYSPRFRTYGKLFSSSSAVSNPKWTSVSILVWPGRKKQPPSNLLYLLKDFVDWVRWLWLLMRFPSILAVFGRVLGDGFRRKCWIVALPWRFASFVANCISINALCIFRWWRSRGLHFKSSPVSQNVMVPLQNSIMAARGIRSSI